MKIKEIFDKYMIDYEEGKFDPESSKQYLKVEEPYYLLYKLLKRTLSDKSLSDADKLKRLKFVQTKFSDLGPVQSLCLIKA